MRTRPFISSQKSRATRIIPVSSSGRARATLRGDADSAIGSGNVSACAISPSMRTAIPTVSTVGTALRRSMSCAMARRRGRELLGPGKPLVRRLQRGKRAAHVAGELQLLAREDEHLLDLREDAV